MIISKCPDCLKNTRVKNFNQIDSPVPPQYHRNSTWYVDYVFPVVQGKKRKVLSILDQVTRYVILEEVRNRDARQLESAFERVFS